MKKTMLTVISVVTSFMLNAQQGIITVKDIKADVPVAQWYVMEGKEYNNHAFFYASDSSTLYELKEILKKDDQDIDFPKGVDEVGDEFWVISHENDFVSHVYLTKSKDADMGMITIVTE
jgi:hypothetical protein